MNCANRRYRAKGCGWAPHIRQHFYARMVRGSGAVRNSMANGDADGCLKRQLAFR